ncbi:hypothetical protein M422DRAFT_35184 [Sphaerobolus stellatus SS14]|uniref:Uncharacterized protein n=1 Tax=Sphaerobolus stellatus (strain SS14) TaxID=990650 RepID=A0A0C9UH88_SPHS4|nr:hypothetical protein M422DRAFT_35184 [Sphaerobolus stellatus SS14]
MSQAVLIMICIHAVSQDVLSTSAPTLNTWLSAISLVVQKSLIMDKICIISAQVEAIISEIMIGNITPKLNIANRWNFSEEEADIFAKKLMKCVEDNLLVS